MTDVMVQTTGEIIDPSDAEALRDAYEQVQEVERRCAEDRRAIAEAFRLAHALPAMSNTVHIPGGKVEVQGGPRDDIDGRGLRASLMTLAEDPDSPITTEQVEAAFTTRSYYSPNKRKWDKFLELGGATVAELVDRATEHKDSPYRLSITRGDD